jgi:hypothetical protein
VRTHRRYLFEGEQLTVPQVASRCTAYGKEWLRRALEDGCTTLADLRAREAAGQQRMIVGQKKRNFIYGTKH